MNRSLHFFLFVLFLSSSSFLFSQNYLRVADPDSWNAPISTQPDWHENIAHGQLDEVTIIAEPQGIFTEIGFYATISQGPDAYSWGWEYEIIWQFDLPGNAIVHDSWLWVGPDIIQADIIDYWTALTTYEDIVDRNEDPSFFYQLPDNRYEIRIYPLPEGGSRRIKMSFLIPSTWDVESVKNNLLQNLLQSTDYLPPTVGIGMPINDLWQSPQLVMNNTLIPMTDTVMGGSGNLLHYLELSGSEFVSAYELELRVDAPLSNNSTFLSTYSEGGENYYQLAFVPDWETTTTLQSKNSLILLDYNDFKTQLSKPTLINYLQTVLGNHFSENDGVNAAVATSSGIQFLSDTWWNYNPDLFADTIVSLLEAQDTVNLEQLLHAGFSWAQAQGDIDHIYLLVANDDYVYPPVADDVFLNLESLLPTVPFTLLDYQDENVSVLFYNNEEYHGNEYFYQLLSNGISSMETIVYRDSNEDFDDLLTQLFQPIQFPTGILDYSTTLESGIAYQRYSLNSSELNEDNRGVIIQTGKYLGNFPMHINANLITDNGQFWNITNSIEPDEVIAGDTLMREMWFGPYLKDLETQAGTENERLFIIDQSINERVLTGLTAFLALEPDQGGEPCIDCLFNDGEPIVFSTEYPFNPTNAKLVASPNPAHDRAIINLIYTESLNSSDWTATIFDISGQLIQELDPAKSLTNTLEWEWNINKNVVAGVYFCKVQSSYGEMTVKIIVLPD